MSLRRLFVLSSLLVLAPSAFPADPNSFLGLCGVSFRAFSSHYRGMEENGWVDVTAIAGKSGLVLSERFGLVEISKFDPSTGDLTTETPRKNLFTPTVYPGTTLESRGRFARLGTAAARELIEARTKKHFKNSDRLPLFFAMRGVQTILGAGPKGTEKYNVMEQAWTAVRVRFPEVAKLDLTEAITQWRLMFPSDGHTSPSSTTMETLSQGFDALVGEYYRITGLNLVKGGILSESPSLWPSGSVLLHSPFLSTEGARGVHGNNLNRYLGGFLSDVPIDVYLHSMAESWKTAEAKYEGGKSRDLHAMKYVPVAIGADSASEALREFKNTGDMNAILPILDPVLRSPRFAAFKDALPAGAIVLAVPSSSGTNQAPDRLAAWVAGKLPGSTHAPGVIRSEGAGSQKLEGNFLDRLANIQEMDVAIGKDVKGKVIVLVDDVVTTGATAEKIKEELMKAGARAVHLFSLARTNVEPLLDVTQGLEGLSSATDSIGATKPPTVTNDRDFMRGITYPTSWAGKTGRQIDVAEKKAKDRFERAFKNADVTMLRYLPAEQLDSLDAKGRPDQRDNVRRALATDSGLLADYVRSLQRASKGGEYPAIKGSPIASEVLLRAKERLGHPPFTNQVGPELVEWIRGQ